MSEPGYLYVVERPYLFARSAGRISRQFYIDQIIVDVDDENGIWGIENLDGPVGIPELVRVIRVLRAPL